MKFQLLTPDHDYSTAMISGGVNGGTIWLWNIMQALKWHGHEAEIKSVTHRLDADYVIVQSESMMNCLHLDNFVGRGGKVITLLGHFMNHRDYLPFNLVKAASKYFFSPWEGKLLDGIDCILMPHGYNDLLEDGARIERKGSIVFAANTYNLRGEEWLEGLDITRIYKTLPQDMPAIYRGADVCINLHGDFQKNIVSTEKNRLSNKPGMMINERFWSVLGSGGLLVCDWVPQMERWFSKEELIIGYNKEEFAELVNYYKDHKKEGLKKLEKAIKKVRNEHTYKQRVERMLRSLDGYPQQA